MLHLVVAPLLTFATAFLGWAQPRLRQVPIRSTQLRRSERLSI